MGGKAAGFGLSDIAFGVGAGWGFELLFVALDRAGADSGAWPLLPGRDRGIMGVDAAFAVAPQMNRIRRGKVRPQLSTTLRWGAASRHGGREWASLLFLFASGAGQLTVVAVLASLLPAFTVLLAAAVLREPIAGTQTVGLVASAASVVLIVIGSCAAALWSPDSPATRTAVSWQSESSLISVSVVFFVPTWSRKVE